MKEYSAIAIPVIFAILLILFFSKKVTWWEMILPTVVGLVMIFGMKGCMRMSNVSDTEYISHHVVKAVYEEHWNEWIKKTCSERYACGTETYTTGSGSSRTTHTRTKYCTRYYDCSYCQDHPAKWYIVDDNGDSYSITQQKFEELCAKWNSRAFVEMNRRAYTIDGDEYVTTWNSDRSTVMATHETHTYENRVQASHSIYNFAEVSDSDKVQNHIFEYPEIAGYSQNCIMSYNYAVSQQQQDKANEINAMLGKKKQVHYFVCVWKGVPYQASVVQQAYWKGGNKNELIVCVGLDANNNVSWANVITWSEKDIVSIKIRDYVNGYKGKPLDLNKLSDFSYDVIDESWERKSFHDFDFLEIELSNGQVAWIYIVVLVLTIGLSFYAVANDFDPEYASNTKFDLWLGRQKSRMDVAKKKMNDAWLDFRVMCKNKIRYAKKRIGALFAKRA